MTANQINFWRLQEDKRHNVSTEGENRRHNVTTEGETYRSNRAKEFLESRSQDETRRHNLVSEFNVQFANRETHRSNLAKEGENSRHNKAQEDETNLHNRNMESLQSYEAYTDRVGTVHEAGKDDSQRDLNNAKYLQTMIGNITNVLSGISAIPVW